MMLIASMCAAVFAGFAVSQKKWGLATAYALLSVLAAVRSIAP
jgi:hypothetical protein